MIQWHGQRDKCCYALKLYKNVTVNPGEGVIVECVLTDGEHRDIACKYGVDEADVRILTAHGPPLCCSGTGR